MKKEYKITKPYFSEHARELAPEYALHLFNDKKYRLYKPKEQEPKVDPDAKGLRPDVMLYEGASHSFLFSFSDLPLLWLAGGVSGQAVLPLQMQLLDGPERFTYRGQAQKEGHDCVVLTVQEQHSGTAVREFWVDREKPYLIRYCRRVTGTRLGGNLRQTIRVKTGWMSRTSGPIRSIITPASYS